MYLVGPVFPPAIELVVVLGGLLFLAAGMKAELGQSTPHDSCSRKEPSQAYGREATIGSHVQPKRRRYTAHPRPGRSRLQTPGTAAGAAGAARIRRSTRVSQPVPERLVFALPCPPQLTSVQTKLEARVLGRVSCDQARRPNLGSSPEEHVQRSDSPDARSNIIVNKNGGRPGLACLPRGNGAEGHLHYPRECRTCARHYGRDSKASCERKVAREVC